MVTVDGRHILALSCFVSEVLSQKSMSGPIIYFFPVILQLIVGLISGEIPRLQDPSVIGRPHSQCTSKSSQAWLFYRKNTSNITNKLNVTRRVFNRYCGQN